MYNIKDLMIRYNLTRQGVQYFVNKNLKIINSDGIKKIYFGFV